MHLMNIISLFINIMYFLLILLFSESYKKRYETLGKDLSSCNNKCILFPNSVQILKALFHLQLCKLRDLTVPDQFSPYLTLTDRFNVSCTRRLGLLRADRASRWPHRPMGRRGRPPGRADGISREHFLRQVSVLRAMG